MRTLVSIQFSLFFKIVKSTKTNVQLKQNTVKRYNKHSTWFTQNKTYNEYNQWLIY